MTTNELVTLNENNVPTTTSLKVAEYFGKRHDNVVRDIRILIDGGVLNFEESDYTTDRGKTYPMYTMDRRAFMILSMGFTGDRALEFKQNFMDAFEAMEAALEKRESPFEIPQTLSEALMLAAKQAEQIELMEPKAEAHDAYLSTDDTDTFTEVANVRQPN